LHQNLLGAGFKHEDRLHDKRWEIGTVLINEANNAKADITAWVLFHTPTHFVIEYLRVDMISPIRRKVTIIDGRRNMKEWVDQMEEETINKRVYNKYRPDDQIKY
jgi:hypothetical protein